MIAEQRKSDPEIFSSLNLARLRAVRAQSKAAGPSIFQTRYSMTAPPPRFLRCARSLVHQIINTRIPCKDPPQISISITNLSTLIDLVSERHKTEPATLVLSGDHYIVGDIHGNIDVLIRIFGKFGYPPHSKYLFLGDYIDRGCNSCEVVLVLYALKLLFPDDLHLLRGNHEFCAMAGAYGFRYECESRISHSIYERILMSFDDLPIAARIGGNYCVHGGISPRIVTEKGVEEVEKLRQTEEYFVSPSYELLWSDPKPELSEFEASPRGCGVLFGKEAVQRFLGVCKGSFRLIRSHESCATGFNWPFCEGGPVLTIFSSCDYCDTGNDAAVAMVTDHDDSARCVTLPLLAPGQAEKRRVLFPDWGFEDLGMAMPDASVGNDWLCNVEIEV
jgi:protein phosphatase